MKIENRTLVVGSVALLVGCSTSHYYQSMSDYTENDFAVISISNYYTTLFQAYDKKDNCLETESDKDMAWKLNGSMKVINEAPLIWGRSTFTRKINNSPLKDDGYIEYKVNPNQYIRIIINPGQGVFAPEVRFKPEAGNYYFINDFDKKVYELSKEEWLINKDSPLLAKKEAKKWDLEKCDKGFFSN